MTLKMVVIPLEKYEKLKLNSFKVTEDSDDNLKVQERREENNMQTNNTDLGEITNQVGEIMKEDNLLTNEDIVQYMPKSHRHKCRVLLFHMKNNGMSWDTFGRLLLKNECILDSHVVDLIRDVISNYKRSCTTPISKQFSELLIRTHCPRSILSKSLWHHGEINSSRKGDD